MPSQQILQKKISEVDEIAQLLKQHEVIGIASLQKVRAAQLQEFKKNLADKVYMRVIKNTLIQRAVEKCKDKPRLKKLVEHLTGANVFLFANLNPFKLALLLERGKVRVTAKTGDIAAIDVTVPAGNTGQPPGPIISQLNAVGIPTRIESGSVWITKDTLVAKKDEVISERLASVISKLGMKPVEAGLKMKVAYDEGLIITGEQLQIDAKKTMESIRKAHKDAFTLSISIAYTTLQTMQMLLQVAHQEAYALAMNTATPTKETMTDLIVKAHNEMLSLDAHLQKVIKK